jgi:tRNA threonylcarbamoyladenosine biosynthesis protein TsaE
MPSAELTLSELVLWGESLGARLQPPAVIALSGELGAGKTTLVQAICRGYGVTEPVTSPTFALVHEYQAPRSVVRHLDLYRLKNAAELANIGWDEAVYGGAVALVEWPERAGGELPETAGTLHLEHVAAAPDKRRLTW